MKKKAKEAAPGKEGSKNEERDIPGISDVESRKQMRRSQEVRVTKEPVLEDGFSHSQK